MSQNSVFRTIQGYSTNFDICNIKHPESFSFKPTCICDIILLRNKLYQPFDPWVRSSDDQLIIGHHNIYDISSFWGTQGSIPHMGTKKKGRGALNRKTLKGGKKKKCVLEGGGG